MLNKLRNFTKTKLATVLIGIIIIPFVFWGMGGVFQGGNTNNIAKIKNVNISTENFFDHIRTLGINEEIISCLLYTSPSPRDLVLSRMPSSA